MSDDQFVSMVGTIITISTFGIIGWFFGFIFKVVVSLNRNNHLRLVKKYENASKSFGTDAAKLDNNSTEIRCKASIEEENYGQCRFS